MFLIEGKVRKYVPLQRLSEVIRLHLWKEEMFRHPGSQAQGRAPPAYGPPAPGQVLAPMSGTGLLSLAEQLFALGKQPAL